MIKNALGAYAREELGLTETNSAQPLQAALFSALSFSAGAVLPLLVAWLAPQSLITALIIFTTLCSLAILGYISSVAGKASPFKAIGSITFLAGVKTVYHRGRFAMAGVKTRGF